MTKKAVERVAAKRKRDRKAGRGQRQGRDGWVVGRKLAFMERYKQEWLDAADNAGEFYTAQTKRFILKAGWDPRFSKRGEDGLDFESDTPDPTEEELKAFVSPKDDAEEKSIYFRELRTKIGQWYRYHYRKIMAGDGLEASVDALLAGLGTAKPIKKRLMHRYSNEHYESRILPAFEAEMARLLQQFEDGLSPQKPSDVSVRNRVTREQWALESEAFRERIQLEIEEEHSRDMAEYEAAVEAANDIADSRTPKEFQKLLTNAAATLDPLAESLSKRYGMAVTILLAGPIPEKGGSIEVLSSNAGRTRGRMPRSWPQMDPAGFNGVVMSMSRFATLMFSQEQCDARALDGAPRRPPPARLASGSGGIFNGLIQMDDMNNDDLGSSGSDEEDEDDDEEEEEPLAVLVEKGKRGKGKRTEKVARKTGEKAKDKAKSAPRAKGKENPGGKGKKVASAGKTSAKTTPPRPKPKAAYKGAGANTAPANDDGGAMLPPPPTNGGDTSIINNEGGIVPPPPPPPATDDGAGTAPPPPPPPATDEGAGAAPPPPPINDGAGSVPPPPPINDGAGSVPPPPASPANTNDGGAVPPPPANEGGAVVLLGSTPPSGEDGGTAPCNEGDTVAPGNNDDGAMMPPPPPPPPPSDDSNENEGDGEKGREDTPPPPWPLIGARWSPELRRVYPWWEAEAARFGDGWEECVWAFVCFEEASGFPAERVRMPVSPARNKVGIDSWISLGRKSWPPTITATPEQYGKWFWNWWRGMQPKARLIEDGVMSRASDIVWDGIRDLSGKNGLLQVVMVLMWWGIKAHSDVASAADAMDWQLAMEDVRWVLDEMVKEGKLSKKRAAERGLLDKKNGPAVKKRR
ncbi:hypothetical protein C8R47DRAFT_1230230 [Mycena vitilis]|nr:hypothetical protein C8R47DRAFT_1230230 [Mycena vitilis]